MVIAVEFKKGLEGIGLVGVEKHLSCYLRRGRETYARIGRVEYDVIQSAPL